MMILHFSVDFFYIAFTPYAHGKIHSQRQWRRRKRLMEAFTTMNNDNISMLKFFDLN